MGQVADAGVAPIVNGVLERVEDTVRAQRRRHTPADDATGKDVDDERDIHKAPPRRHVAEGPHPELIGRNWF
jgi:hypothetical protein